MNTILLFVYCILLTEEIEHSSHFHFYHGFQDIKIHHILLAQFHLNSYFIHNLVARFLREDDPKQIEIFLKNNVLNIKLYIETFVYFVLYIL
jgi:hypothetical protein